MCTFVSIVVYITIYRCINLFDPLYYILLHIYIFIYKFLHFCIPSFLYLKVLKLLDIFAYIIFYAYICNCKLVDA